MNINLYLDELLKLLNEQRKVEPLKRQPLNVTEFMQERPEIVRHEEFIDLVDILLKDKNARLIPGKEYQSRIDEYRDCLITLQGLQFLEHGAYQTRHHAELLSTTEVLERETSRHGQAHRLNRLTAWLAVGTTIAAIYYVLQILTFFHLI